MNRWYAPWVAAGRQFMLAQPIAEAVAQLTAAYPKMPDLFGTIGDLAHLEAATPQDHTPYSQTGWPVAAPYGVVTAMDIMHRPELGVDCDQIFAHLLASVKDTSAPWVKYIIWKRKIYDTRQRWVPQPADNHDDHLHISARTDFLWRSLGGWSIVPGGDMFTQAQVNAVEERLRAVFQGDTADWVYDPATGAMKHEGNPLWALLRAIEAKVDALTPAGGVSEERVKELIAGATLTPGS